MRVRTWLRFRGIARSLFELGRALLARGRPGDELRAVDLLERAEPLARTLGMRSLTTQAR